MPATQFDIVFRGVRAGYDVSLAKVQFARLFKLDSATVEQIFKSSNISLKNHVDERLANIFVARLLAIGVVAHKLSIQPFVSKAIRVQDWGETCTETDAMHQPVEFLYGEHTRRTPFVFTGSGFDYCKIWLVNLLVCLFSAGILYPWAQVRSLRYFYQHTQLDSSEFHYTSKLQKIFLVQFALVACVIGLVYTFFYSPILCLIVIASLISTLPIYWFKRGAFQCKHSFYHHISFRQDASLRDVYLVFLGWPLLIVLSAGLFTPYAAFKMQQYWVQSTSFGNYTFTFSGNVKNYFRLLLPLLLAECITVTCIYWSHYVPFWVPALIIVFVWLVVFIRWRVDLVNLQWNGTASKLGYFAASWGFQSYAKLVFTNLLLCIATCGFYWPWAKVNVAKYKATHLAFFSNQRFKKWRHACV